MLFCPLKSKELQLATPVFRCIPDVNEVLVPAFKSSQRKLRLYGVFSWLKLRPTSYILIQLWALRKTGASRDKPTTIIGFVRVTVRVRYEVGEFMTIFSSFPFAVGWKHSKILRPKENSEKAKAEIFFLIFFGSNTVSEDIQTKTAPKKTA